MTIARTKQTVRSVIVARYWRIRCRCSDSRDAAAVVTDCASVLWLRVVGTRPLYVGP